MAQLKEQHKQMEENKANGHGALKEIVEEEFLPVVTKT
jgi:hypothetical protein